MDIKKAVLFERKLYELINTSGLSLEVTYYILKCVFMDFQKTISNIISSEAEEKVEKKEETQNEGDITSDLGSANDD